MRLSNRIIAAGLLAGLMIGLAAGRSTADFVSEMLPLDQASSAFNQEIVNQNKNIADMRRILDDYAAGRGPAPRADQLKPMGQAGVGVIGAGHSKHPAVKKFIEEYESVFNPQNWSGAAKTLNEIAGERRKLIPKRKQELGLGPNDELPEAEKKAVQDIAVGVAHFKVEITRSEQAIGRLRAKVADINRERSSLFAKMSETEKNNYLKRPQQIAEPSPAPALVPDNNGPSPTAAAPAATNDPTLIARLDKILADLDAAAGRLESRIVQESENCKQRMADAMMPNGPNSIAEQAKAADKANSELLAALWPNRQDDQAAYNNFRTTINDLKRIAGQTVAAADLACARLGEVEPNFSGGKDSVSRARNLGILANALAADGLAAANKLFSRLNTVKSENSLDSFDAKVAMPLQHMWRFCAKLPLQPLDGAIDAELSKIGNTAFDQLRLVTQDRDRIGAKLTATYLKRFGDHQVRVRKIRDRFTCGSDSQAAIEACKATTERMREKALKFREEGEQLAGTLMNSIGRIRAEESEIASLINQTTTARERAAQCLADAESKKPAPDPKLIGEANELGDPSKAACKSADLRSRAARLRDPKFSSVPGVKDKAAELDRLAGVYDTAKGHFEQARAAYGRADISLVHAELDKAQAKIDSIAGKIDCSSSNQTIAQARDRADRLATAIQRAEETLKQCEPGTLRAHSEAIEQKTKHPALAALKQRMQRQLAAIGRFNAANASYKAGNLSGARDQLSAIKASLSNAPAADCPTLQNKIDDNLDRIATLTRVTSQADEAIRSCNVDGIKRFINALPNSEQSTLKQMRGRLSAALENCSRRATDSPSKSEIARAHAECRAKLGDLGLAVHAPDRLSGYRCSCESPFELNGSACVRQKTGNELTDAAEMTREQIIADANRRCQEANNNNKRARAGKHLGNGQWTCVIERTRAQVIADAHRSCQVANRNKRARAVKQLRDGRWSCTIPGQRQVRQPQPNYNDAAAAAAAGAIIMQGVDALINSQVRRPPQTRWQPQTRTHRQPIHRPPATSRGRCNVRDPLTGKVGCY